MKSCLGTGMNEWSPKEFYSGSQTTDQLPQTQPYRQYWEEDWSQGRSEGNSMGTNTYRTGEFVPGSQFLVEDVGIPPSYSGKKKKNGTDPRFKKVIQTEMRGDAGEGMASLQQYSSALEDQINEERLLTEKVISYLKVPSDMSPYSKESCQEDLSAMVTKDVGLKPAPGYPAEIVRAKGKTIPNSKTSLKRSASDCTLHKNYKLPQESEEAGSQRVRPYPSATRLNRLHDWVKEYNMPPEKRRSVITVIGQTQTKSFSKVLNEINQRRKLAKELDKHALCQAIMETGESPSDLKNLVAKVDFVLPDGKVIYSAEKVYLSKDGKFSSDKVCMEGSKLAKEVLECSDQGRKKCDMIPERDSSVSQMGRKPRTKRSSKKTTPPFRERIVLEDSMKPSRRRMAFKLLWLLLLVAGMALSACACFYPFKPCHNSFGFSIFKPKTTAWYEKLLF